MIALLGAVLVSAVAGSLHCAAMCGPLAGAAGRGQAAYAAGRLAGYVVLGVVAGAVGAAVDLAGDLASVSGVAMIVAGVALLGWGAWSLATALGWRRGGGGGGEARPMLYAIRRRGAHTRGALIGLVTPALPCGWLWAFVVIAAGTGDPAGGALVMATLWLGSAPALLGAGLAMRALARRLGRRLPVVTACLQIAVGATALAVRAPMIDAHPIPDGVGVPTEPACH